MISHTFIRILRKREDTTGLCSCPKSMGFTDRIIADVYTLMKKLKEEMQAGKIKALPVLSAKVIFDIKITYITKECNKNY